MATRVTLEDGRQGILETESRFLEPGKAVVLLDMGRRVVVPVEALTAQEDGSYRLPLTAEALEAPALSRPSSAEDTLVMTRLDEETVVVPVIAETFSVSKQTVVTGGVRLSKRVSEHTETVDEPLLHEDVQVERVPINQIVAEAPQSRYEGDTLIVPVLEEVLVVEKRVLLKEEIHIHRTQTQVHQPQQVNVRVEDVVIEEIIPSETRI